jgi:hypothetical protein
MRACPATQAHGRTAPHMCDTCEPRGHSRDRAAPPPNERGRTKHPGCACLLCVRHLCECRASRARLLVEESSSLRDVLRPASLPPVAIKVPTAPVTSARNAQLFGTRWELSGPLLSLTRTCMCEQASAFPWVVSFGHLWRQVAIVYWRRRKAGLRDKRGLSLQVLAPLMAVVFSA